MIAKLAQKEQEHAKRQAKALGRSLEPLPPKVSAADRLRIAKAELAKRVLTRQKAEVEVLACQACITKFASAPVVDGSKTEFDWLTDHHAYVTERSAVRSSVGDRLATTERRLKQALNKEMVSVESFRLANLTKQQVDAGLASRARLPKQAPELRDKFEQLRSTVRDELQLRKRAREAMDEAKVEDASAINPIAPESPLTIEEAF